MPMAICTTCDTPLYWRNQRGARLADMRCYCGGQVVAATWADGHYVRRAKPAGATKGQRKTICSVCGRACMTGSHDVVTAGLGLRNIGGDSNRLARAEWVIQVQADDQFCRICRPSREYPYIGWHRFEAETREWLTTIFGFFKNDD